MNEEYTIEECLIIANNILQIVREELADFNHSNDYLNCACINLNHALTSLEQDELAALVEYQITIENLLNSDEDFSSYVDLLNE